MDQETRPITRDDLHATYLERSIRELQRALQEEEGAVAEVCLMMGMQKFGITTTHHGSHVCEIARSCRAYEPSSRVNSAAAKGVFVNDSNCI